MFYNCIIHEINIATKSKFQEVLERQLKKLDKIRGKKTVLGNGTRLSMYIKDTVHNFSSCGLSDKEYKTLSYGLDHHIPPSSNYNAVETEFDLFYQNILSNISHIHEK